MESTRKIAIQKVNEHLSKGVKLCSDSSLSSLEVKKLAEPVLSVVNHLQWKTKLRRYIVAAVIIGVIASVLQAESIWNFACVIGKLIQIKLLSVWDWTVIYNRECLFSNPYFREKTMTEEDCEPCTTYKLIDALDNVTHREMAEDYLLSYLPVVVTDDAIGWLAREKFDKEFLIKLYTEEEPFRNAHICNFHSSTKHSNIDDLLDWLPEADDFSAHWFHCDISTIKAFRKFYKRPYSLPPMVGFSDRNYIIIGSGKKNRTDSEGEETFHTFYTRDTMTWFAQVKGQYKVKLNPGYPCHDACHPLEFILEEGHILSFMNSVWWFQISPTSSNLSIALGSSGTWHKG